MSSDPSSFKTSPGWRGHSQRSSDSARTTFHVTCMYMASPTVPTAVGFQIIRVADELAFNGMVVELWILVHHKNPDVTT